MRKKGSIFGSISILTFFLLPIIANGKPNPHIKSVDDDSPDKYRFVEAAHPVEVKVAGLRVEGDIDADPVFLGYNSLRHSVIKPDEKVRVVLFGAGFVNLHGVTFTADGTCNDIMQMYNTEFSIMTNNRLVVEMSFPRLTNEKDTYKLCVSERINFNTSKFMIIDDSFNTITTSVPAKKYILPLWAAYPVFFALLILSGLFSGLNIGLMTLSPFELTLYQKSGTDEERKYADKILPIRKKGNRLLCTLLIGNVVVNSAISLLLDDVIGSGLYALIGSSIGIVIFGEIVPQAICVKRGLQIGAFTVPLTRMIMFVLAPMTKPIAYVLDKFFKEELTQTLERNKLMEMVRLCSSDPGVEIKEEWKVVMGALELHDKTVVDSMTRIDDVFMLPHTLKLGPSVVNHILEMGYTRIPIYENIRDNIVGLLFVKDLALIDPDDQIDIMKISNYYKHEVRTVFDTTPLKTMLEEFKRGEYHLAFVQRVVNSESDDADPYYELMGLITLEDIIEEIIQAEIIDETDAVCDNINKKKRHRKKNHDISRIINMESANCPISIQMQVVAVQWFSTAHPAFSSKYIHPGVLDKLIRQHCKKIETTNFAFLQPNKIGIAQAKTAALYTKGELSDRFILILEGSMVVTIGQENMVLEAGPWQTLGMEILDMLVKMVDGDSESSGGNIDELDISYKKLGFYPDFNAVVRHECTFCEITVSDWILAYKASALSSKLAEEPLLRPTSRSSLIEDGSFRTSMHNGSTPKKRSQSENEKVELLPKTNEMCTAAYTKISA